MQTLASILAGAGGNPYSGGDSLAPYLQQALLAQQLGPSGIGQAQQPAPLQQQSQMPQYGQPQPLTGFGGLGAMGATLPGLVSGAY